jgi:tetratricopeptide (TPR) repeat protein
MLTDRYGLALSTASAAARDAYVEACDLLLTLYPGAGAAFDRAIEADPGFALAHAGKARVLQLGGNMAAARAALAAAGSADGLSAREASHLDVFRLLVEGQPNAALAAIRAHTGQWPLDAMVLAPTATQIGLIGTSGRSGRDRELAEYLDSLAPHYGDDWWFDAHYGMALSEVGRRAEARPRIDRSLARNPRNASVAHAFAHICYEDGQVEDGIAFLRSWLPEYSRAGGMFGHLSWHLALFELHRGNAEEGLRMFADSFGAEDYFGPPPNKMFDAASFLWRAELAGQPRDEARWAMLRDYAHARFPQPGLNLLDWHIALAEAVTGETDALETRARTMDELAVAGRYPAGHTILGVGRAFAAFERKDYPAAIALLEPVLAERERLGGSNAQVDLVEFTLLRACLLAGRKAEAQRLLRARRPGPAGVPVAGAVALH